MSHKETKDEQLSREIDTGVRAQKFYDTFVERFVEEKRLVIFEAFEATSPTDLEALSELRRMLSIVNIFDTEIRTYIETGQMAQMSVNKEEKH